MSRIFTICAFTDNSPGVLHRVTVMFTRRKVNIESLTVSETETKGVSRFTICIRAEAPLVEKIAKQINRIVEVRSVFFAENSDLVYKEIAFYRITAESPEQRVSIEEVAHRYGAHITIAKDGYLVVEKTGTEDEINSLFLLLQPLGIKEFVRSGRIAILSGDPASA